VCGELREKDRHGAKRRRKTFPASKKYLRMVYHKNGAFEQNQTRNGKVNFTNMHPPLWAGLFFQGEENLSFTDMAYTHLCSNRIDSD
jgi:hypothetical protein